MVRGRVFLAAAIAVGSLALACNALLGMGDFRACEGAECGDASADAGDAGVPATACASNADCASADAGTICSQGRCAGFAHLARGMADLECVVLTDGTARCWGHDDMGQLGTGSTSPTLATPQIVMMPSTDGGLVPMDRIVDLQLANAFACASRSDQSVWCWGSVPGSSGGPVARQVSLGNVSVVAISLADTYACALVTQGTNELVECWGTNDYGQMACSNGSSCADAGVTPSSPPMSVPWDVPNTGQAAFVAAGRYALCIGRGDEVGTVDCWGQDAWGNLADGLALVGSCCRESQATDAGAPALGSAIQELQAATWNACGKNANGQWLCWGANSGEGCPLLGPGCNDQLEPTVFNGGHAFLELSPGWRHMCGTTNDAVYCWGQDDHAQVGDGKPPQTQAPVTNATLVAMPADTTPVRDLAAHRHFTCAIGKDGEIYCWGQNGDQFDPTPWLVGVGSKMGDYWSPTLVGFE